MDASASCVVMMVMIETECPILAHELYMRLIGMQNTTIVMRCSVLRQFWRFLSEKDLMTVTKNDVISFIARPQLKDGSRSVYLANIRSFYSWAEDECRIDHNPCAKIKTPKRKNGVPRPMPTEDLIQAVAVARPTVRVWLLLAAFAGLRCVEMSRIKGEDLDLESTPARMVVHGKGGHRAVVPLHPVLTRELKQWTKPGYLFPHKIRAGEHVTAASVSKAINEHLRKIGSTYTAHSARHLFATTAYRQSGHDLLLTRDLLRHSSVHTTQVYAQTDPVDAALVVSGLSYGLIDEGIA